MTQANDAHSESTSPGTVAENQSTAEGLGNKLRTVREQRSLSREQVAEALHLDETVIVALEREQFELLGAPVYVRGHLKTYAQLLGLSPAAIAGEYQPDDSLPMIAPMLQQAKTASISVNPVLWAGGALAILLGLLLGFYVLLGSDNDADLAVAMPRSIDAPVVVEPVQALPPAVDDVAAIETAADAGTENKVPVRATRRIAVALPVVTERPGSAAETEAAGENFAPVPKPIPRPVATLRLGLQFSQESWVEISDANRRLLFGRQREGNRREVIGEPPFSLVIGNADGVTLTVNDEPFDIPAERVRGKVARFEITGADSGQAE